MPLLNRLALLATGLLAAYQIAVGIDGLSALPVLGYTIAFGALLLASLLLIIFGSDALDSPAVVIISTIIPLGLATGLIAQHQPGWTNATLIFALAGLLSIALTRTMPIRSRLPLVVLVIVHGIAGLTIFILPIWRFAAGRASWSVLLVSLGGALIGPGVILLGLLKAGRPLLSRSAVHQLLPILLLLMTAAFVAGFARI